MAKKKTETKTLTEPKMANKKARGDRGWTTAQKKAASIRVTEHHERVRAMKAPENKENVTHNMTLAKLHTMLGNLLESGVKKTTAIEFLPSCCDGVEIHVTRKPDSKGKLREFIAFR